MSPATARRTPSARRTALVVAPLATLAVIGAGALTTGAAAPDAAPASAVEVTSAQVAPSSEAVSEHVLGREATVPTSPQEARVLATSRSTDRVALLDTEVPRREGRRWSTAPLKLRGAPTDRAKVRGVLPASRRVTLTGARSGVYAEIVTGRVATRWVTAKYLARSKPKPPPPPPAARASARTTASSTGAPAGLSSAPCPDGSSIESALQPQAVKVYRAVCAAFPELSSYGGQDGHGEHVNGEAIDFMVPSSSVGERVKDFLYAHHTELGLFDIIWAQHIWTIERAGEGFRSMPDRGSATANHFDHVHIKIN